MVSMRGLGGLPPLRPDQASTPPVSPVSPGAQAILRARIVIISGLNDGLFVYDGTPAAGNLVESIAADAGTDLYGNPYYAGITSYSSGGVVNIDGGVEMIWPA
jgi:hypothetical protein